MDNTKRCCKRRSWQCLSGVGKDVDIAGVLTFSNVPAEHDFTQLLADIENTLGQKDGHAIKVPMSQEVQNYASHLQKHLNKALLGAQFSKEVLNALGTQHWIGAGLTIIAMGLDMVLKMHDNKEQCDYIMKESLDIWKKVMKPVLENNGLASEFMEESMGIIIEGYLSCKKLSNSRTLKRFICVICHEKELQMWKKKQEAFLMKANAVMAAELIGKHSLTPPTASKTSPTTIVGLEGRKRDVMKLLKLEDIKEETRVVVLHGMGGVGKSTLAEVVYKEVSRDIRHHSRIDLGEKPTKDHITNMQRKMVENLTGVNLTAERDPEVIRDILRQLVLLRAAGDPVLIYIDNVLQVKDLEEVIPLDCELITLPKGSRWLVTTRDESVCTKFFKRNKGFEVQQLKVKSLNDEDARKLFFLHAFGQEEPSSEVVKQYDDDRGLIQEMTKSICGNLPLALRVLGRSLFDTNVSAWRKKYNDLKSHGKLELEEQIRNVLKSSYDTLNDDTKTALLMACVCFYNELFSVFKHVMDSILPGAEVLRLIELGLLERYSSSSQKKVYSAVKMHDLVRTLGYQIAVTRKCAPTKMLTCKEDFLDLNDESWSEMKWLRVPALEDGIEAELLEKCKELEVIVLGTHVNGHIGNPPEQLKVVCTSSRFPVQLDKLKEVVYLNVGEPIEEYPVAPSTGKLQVFFSFGGASIPKKGIDLHKNTLRQLWCRRIKELSSYFCQEMTKLEALRLLDFEGESFPEEMGSLASLEVLRIRSSNIQNIPQSLAHLKRLQHLRLELQNLKEIPSGVLGGMKELVVLQLKLESVTSMPMQDIGQLASLESLDLRLPRVNRLLTDAAALVLSLKLGKLKWFRLWCKSMSSVEGVQLSCPSLQVLILQLQKIEVLPAKFITGSTKLRNLGLAHCESLQELSAETEILWGLESLAVTGCRSLKAIPEGMMKSVESAALVGCPSLAKLPGDVDEEKAGSMHFLACDAHLLPPQFLPLPSVLAFSPGDWRAAQLLDSYIFDTFFPVSTFDT